MTEIKGVQTFQLMGEVKRSYNLYYFILIIGLLTIVSGILMFLIIKLRAFGIGLMAVGGTFTIPFGAYLPLVISAQTKISKLYKEGDSETLIRYVNEKQSLTKGNYVYFAIAALGDMSVVKALPVLERHLERAKNTHAFETRKKATKAIAKIGTTEAVRILRNALITNERESNSFWVREEEVNSTKRQYKEVSNVIKSALEALAKTNNYKTVDEMMAAIEEGRREKLDFVLDKREGEKAGVVKITYNEEVAIGMITHMQIDEEEKEIIACPYCLNIEKEELMSMWLKEKKKCPVCRREISMKECLQVKFEKEEKKGKK